MSLGQIIYLNGTSSSGKTSIAKALQDMLEQPFFHVSIDDFFEMLPPRFGDEPTRELTIKVVSGLQHSVAALSRTGNNVIVDDVVDLNEFWQSCIEALAELPVLLVGVKCSVTELEKREQARGDRPVGMARRQLARVHKYDIYDVEVDSSLASPEECARQIISALTDHRVPSALMRLKDILG
jgi:chloramphenicol 3-O phosphotransferase